MSFARRLAITLGVPLLLLVLGDHLLLPGIPPDIAGSGGSRANVGVFALGIQPILTAYWLVEVIAFLVPRWSSLRHGNPEGRARLDRAARFLLLALAGVQALGMALSLQAIGDESGLPGQGAGFTISVPIVVVTLIGGVCIQFVFARLISRHGLMNGFMALFGASLLREIAEDATKKLGFGPRPSGALVEPRHLAVDALALVVAVVATWAAVRGAGCAPRAGAEGGASATPYRSARWLVVHPWIPVPSSSFQPYVFAAALLVLPATLANFGLPTRGLLDFIQRGDVAYTVAFLLLLGGTMVVFARLLHRPAEMADLATRLGAADGKKLRAQARDALQRTLLPSFLFFAAIALAPYARLGASAMAMLTVVLMDLIDALRTDRRDADLVPVWEERRASAVPVLRAALAADGIATETRGMAVLSFWQVFAPYAPAQILVRREDAERATRVLRHLLAGDEGPDRTEAPGEPWRVPSEPWSLPRRTAILAGCAAAAVLLTVGKTYAPPPGAAPVHRANLEVVRIDDAIDPFATVPDESIPDGQGIGVYQENAPVGPGRSVMSHYVRVVSREGETTSAAIARVRPWLSTIRLPPGARLGFEQLDEYDEDTRKTTVVGFRTFVLVGEAVLRTEDVTEAVASIDSSNEGAPDAYVAVTLSSAGATRFESATREWTQRRLAILVDDRINSAPVIRTAISGGRISISMGRGDPERKIAEAKSLAQALGGR